MMVVKTGHAWPSSAFTKKVHGAGEFLVKLRLVRDNAHLW